MNIIIVRIKVTFYGFSAFIRTNQDCYSKYSIYLYQLRIRCTYKTADHETAEAQNVRSTKWQKAQNSKSSKRQKAQNGRRFLHFNIYSML
jgi:hypothetical protein